MKPIYKAYKFRLYPNNDQEILINKTFDSIRSIYKGHEYNNIKVDLKNRSITLLKLEEIKIRGYRNLNNIEGKIINVTNEIVSNYDVVVSEKLNVKRMMQNHRLAESISDASFNKICESCHNENDRDINASVNIMFEGLKLHYKSLLYNK